MSQSAKIDLDELARIIGYKEIRLQQSERQVDLLAAEVLARDDQIAALRRQLEETIDPRRLP